LAEVAPCLPAGRYYEANADHFICILFFKKRLVNAIV